MTKSPIWTTAAALGSLLTLTACETTHAMKSQLIADRPKLGIVIVVDQMRADYLEEYNAYFSGGFRRMLDEGVVFQNAWVDHAYTNSLPGHTTIITGTYPRTHGVVDNVWHQPGDGKDVVRSGYSLIDRSEGAPYELGALTLPEIVLRTSPASRFAAIGSNGATRIYAGQLKGHVYWLDPQEGYITNTNYADGVAEWVEAFNQSRLADLAATDWTSSLPNELASSLRADNSAFENDGTDMAFPHVSPASGSSALGWVYNTPYADQATLELAGLVVKKLGLGDDDSPDILAISLNSLDQIGHAYGPFSHEMADALLRLDASLGEFFEMLDEAIGEDNWIVALSADHGANTTPEQRRLWGSVEGRRIDQATARDVADAAHAAASEHEDPNDAAAAVLAVRQFDFVETAYTEQQVAAFSPGIDTIEGLIAQSYSAGRIPAHPFYIRDKALAELGVYIVLKEDIMMDWATAIHGSQYDYDRRVPLIFLGGGLESTKLERRIATVDLAPTILDLLQIGTVTDLDGKSAF